MNWFFSVLEKVKHLFDSMLASFSPSYSLFPPCYHFLSRYVPIFSMANACIQPRYAHLHILKHIVHLMQTVSWLSVSIMSKENVFVKRANIFIHLNILLHNWKQLKRSRLPLLHIFFPMQQARLPFSIPHRRYNWFIPCHWTVVSRYWLHHRLLISTLNKHLQHLLLPRHWYALNPLHASIAALLCYFDFSFSISSTISFQPMKILAIFERFFFSSSNNKSLMKMMAPM